MTIGNLHEEILDDIRFIGKFHRDYGYTINDVGVLADAILANLLLDTVGCGPVADAYVFVNDGHGPIVVEVGRMRDGKWSNYIAPDRKPIRTLRVGFDRSIWLLNPRKTSIENDLMRYWQQELSIYN